MVSFFIDFDSLPKCKSYAYKFLTHCRVASHDGILFQHSELSRTQIITWKDAKRVSETTKQDVSKYLSRAVVLNVFSLIQKIVADLLGIVCYVLSIWHPRKSIVLTRELGSFLQI